MPGTLNNVRVVIADDSDIAAAYLERLLEKDPAIRVVGRARDGAELLTLPQLEMTHWAIVDVLMPGVAGLSLIRRLTKLCQVIVVSSMSHDSRVAQEAMALGARAFFCKQDLTQPAQAERLRALVKSQAPASAPAMAGHIVLVVGSTGAIVPLELLVDELRSMPLPVLVVQHLPTGKAEELVRLFSARGVQARLAQHGSALEHKVYVAPVGRHMQLDSYERIRLVSGPAVSQHCPSGDVLLESAAMLGRRAIAVILSGLGNDGARGIKALAASGATCLVQQPEECGAAYMPRAALSASRRVRPVSTRAMGAAIRQVINAG